MLTFLKKYPFQTYAILILGLAAYTFYSFRLQGQQDALYQQMDAVYKEQVKLEYNRFQRNYTSLEYEYQKGYHPKQDRILQVAKTLSKYVSDLNKTYTAGSWDDLKAEEKAQGHIETLQSSRDSLYAFLKELNADSELDSILIFEEIPASNPIVSKPSARLSQQFLMERSKVLHDLDAATKALTVLSNTAEQFPMYNRADFLPIISLEKSTVKVGETIRGEAFSVHHIIEDEGVVLTVNGDTIPTERGIGTLEKIYWTAGTKTFVTTWALRNPYTNKVNQYKKTFKIEVAK